MEQLRLTASGRFETLRAVGRQFVRERYSRAAGVLGYLDQIGFARRTRTMGSPRAASGSGAQTPIA